MGAQLHRGTRPRDEILARAQFWLACASNATGYYELSVVAQAQKETGTESETGRGRDRDRDRQTENPPIPVSRHLFT